MSTEEQPDLRLQPDLNISYPIQVLYCGNCSLPIEVNFIENQFQELIIRYRRGKMNTN